MNGLRRNDDELPSVSEAARFLNLSVPTLYGKVSSKEILVNKQGKRLHFYKSELADWIKAGRKKTIMEGPDIIKRYSRIATKKYNKAIRPITFS